MASRSHDPDEARFRPQTARSEDHQIRFQRIEGRPDQALAGLVHRYTGYSHHGVGVLRRREPAQGAVSVILSFASPMRVSGPASAAKEASNFVAPLCDSYAVTEEAAVSHGLQIDLSPFGAFMLLGESMRGLTDPIVPIEDLLGDPAAQLVERLFHAADWKARIRVLDAFVLGRVREARRPSPDVVWAWRRLSETQGRLPIAALARELGCSRRHLVSRFREQVGPAPKSVARILRFQHARRLLANGDGSHLAEIALDCGYYDQAHLNREFRELAGASPTELLAKRLPGDFGVFA